MSDFNFTIVGDAPKALRTIELVEGGLDKIQPAARAAGDAISRAFNQSASVADGYARTLAKGGSAASTYAAALRPLNEQLEAEKRILQEIHGPIEKYATDVQALNALLAKGEISATQFNAALARAKSTAGGGVGGGGAGGGGGLNLGSIAGSLPGGSIISGFVGGGVAGGAAAGLQAAVGATGQIIEMADAYTGLNNRLRALTGSQTDATRLFNELHTSANKTRSDINTTAQSFVQFSRATRDLGLSQNQVLQFTERLNEAIALSGADSTAASNGLYQLSQALASGALRGQDLHSVMQQIPVVAQVIQDHLHVTAGKFKEMADNGQISAKVVIDAFNEAGPKIDAGFADSVPTISQQFQVLKNDVSATVGELMQSINASGSAGEAVKQLGLIVKVTADQFKYANDTLGLVGLNLSDITAGSGTGLQAISDGFMEIVDSATQADYSFDGFRRAMTGAPIAQEKFSNAQEVINRVIAEGTGKLREYDEQMIQMALRLAGGEAAAKGFADSIYQSAHAADAWNDAAYKGETINSRILGLLGDAAMVWDKINEKAKTHTSHLQHHLDLLAEIRSRLEFEAALRKRQGAEQAEFDRVAVLGLKEQAENEKEEMAARTAIGQATIDINQRAADLITKNGEVVNQALDEQAKRQAENAERVREAWAAAAGQIGADLIRGLAAGDLKVDQLIEKAALLAIQLAATQIGGPGGAFIGALTSGLGGGANGFDYLTSSAWRQRPGFASGGDAILQGVGGTDSVGVAFRMTPGESLHVRTPSQRRDALEAAAGGQTHVTVRPIINLQNDRRDLVQGMDSRDGERILVKLDRKLGNRRR